MILKDTSSFTSNTIIVKAIIGTFGSSGPWLGNPGLLKSSQNLIGLIQGAKNYQEKNKAGVSTIEKC